MLIKQYCKRDYISYYLRSTYFVFYRYTVKKNKSKKLLKFTCLSSP